MKTAVAPTEVRIELPQLNIKQLTLTLIGDSPLIVHRWSEKAKKEMLDKQMKKAKVAKAAKDPQADYEASLYRLDRGKYGFPVVGFKAAAVNACSHVDGITKVEARGAFHVSGEYAVIDGEPEPREDMVRIAMGTADIRYRAQFRDWKTTLHIRYNANVLSAEQIVNLFNTAGFASGVGEWRPQKNGSYGMFHVATQKEAA